MRDVGEKIRKGEDSFSKSWRKRSFGRKWKRNRSPIDREDTETERERRRGDGEAGPNERDDGLRHATDSSRETTETTECDRSRRRRERRSRVFEREERLWFRRNPREERETIMCGPMRVRHVWAPYHSFNPSIKARFCL